jgi:hypothetical protein
MATFFRRDVNLARICDSSGAEVPLFSMDPEYPHFYTLDGNEQIKPLNQLFLIGISDRDASDSIKSHPIVRYEIEYKGLDIPQILIHSGMEMIKIQTVATSYQAIWAQTNISIKLAVFILKILQHDSQYTWQSMIQTISKMMNISDTKSTDLVLQHRYAIIKFLQTERQRQTSFYVHLERLNKELYAVSQKSITPVDPRNSKSQFKDAANTKTSDYTRENGAVIYPSQPKANSSIVTQSVPKVPDQPPALYWKLKDIPNSPFGHSIFTIRDQECGAIDHGNTKGGFSCPVCPVNFYYPISKQDWRSIVLPHLKMHRDSLARSNEHDKVKGNVYSIQDILSGLGNRLKVTQSIPWRSDSTPKSNLPCKGKGDIYNKAIVSIPESPHLKRKIQDSATFSFTSIIKRSKLNAPVIARERFKSTRATYVWNDNVYRLLNNRSNFHERIYYIDRVLWSLYDSCLGSAINRFSTIAKMLIEQYSSSATHFCLCIVRHYYLLLEYTRIVEQEYKFRARILQYISARQSAVQASGTHRVSNKANDVSLLSRIIHASIIVRVPESIPEKKDAMSRIVSRYKLFSWSMDIGPAQRFRHSWQCASCSAINQQSGYSTAGHAPQTTSGISQSCIFCGNSTSFSLINTSFMPTSTSIALNTEYDAAYRQYIYECRSINIF